jgi:hypothetical protein
MNVRVNHLGGDMLINDNYPGLTRAQARKAKNRVRLPG